MEEDKQQILILGVVGALVLGGFVAASYVVYHKFCFQTGHVAETAEIQQTLGTVRDSLRRSQQLGGNWVDVSEFNGGLNRNSMDRRSRPYSQGVDRRSRPYSQNSRPISADRRSYPVPAPAPQIHVERPPRPDNEEEDAAVLPSDIRFPAGDFRKVLEQYYKKWSPSMESDDIDLALATYGGDQAGRVDLDRQLADTYGQSLDEYFVAKKNGEETDVAPAAKKAQEPRVPSIRIVGDYKEMSLNETSDFERALNARGCGEYYETLVHNGIATIEDMKHLTEETVNILFKDSTARRKILEIVAASKLLNQNETPEM